MRDEAEQEPPAAIGDPIPRGLLEEMWRHYPRKIGQDAAFPEMEAAIRRVQLQRGTDVQGAAGWILSRVKAFARSDMVVKGEARYVPKPSRWFQEGRYSDDDAAWVGGGDSIRLTEPRAVDALAEWERTQGGAA